MMDSIVRFNQLFSKEKDCIRLVHKLKWPSGFHCTSCNHTTAYTISTRRLPLYECSNCKHQTSLTSGTVMDKSRTPLRKWLLTMYILSTCENSINAVQLSELIGVTYKTAWIMLNKLRQAISDSDRSILLSGVVEAKLEIYMKQPIPTYDALQKEQAVIAARTIEPSDFSYFKIKLVHYHQNPRGWLSKQAESEFIYTHVSPNLSQIEINKRFVNPPRSEAVLPRIAKSAFNWINNTFHGLGPLYSQAYLDEYCFRQNHSYKQGHCPFEFLLQLCLSIPKSNRTSTKCTLMRLAS
ncbi:transposase [Paenibacillus prosopidis]|uniref:Transposase-like zinc ribbon protein n=1 Tax=Paenibacillus prosopidis TaxID=630520 RepID=A0A368VXD7_9BACL|nr:transposase [Paenibacillus prosopidis]RCW44852.1 transposase-like zinc ribbon protein [Paenibacillus prosopidis]